MPTMTSEPLVLSPPADFQTRFPDVVRLAQHLSLRYVHRYVVSEQELQTVGGALWRTRGGRCQAGRRPVSCFPPLLSRDCWH